MSRANIILGIFLLLYRNDCILGMGLSNDVLERMLAIHGMGEGKYAERQVK